MKTRNDCQNSVAQLVKHPYFSISVQKGFTSETTKACDSFKAVGQHQGRLKFPSCHTLWLAAHIHRPEPQLVGIGELPRLCLAAHHSRSSTCSRDCSASSDNLARRICGTNEHPRASSRGTLRTLFFARVEASGVWTHELVPVESSAINHRLKSSRKVTASLTPFQAGC